MENIVKNKKVSIKICGITREEETIWLNEADVDYAGFVFFEKSKRNISIPKAQEIFRKLKSEIKKVAVVVSPDLKQLHELEAAGFDIVQVHGEWNREFGKELHIPIWQAVNLKTKEEIKNLKDFDMTENNLKAVLFDAGDYGSGKTFGWDTSEKSTAYLTEFEAFRSRLKEKGILFILAGGLHPQNVASGIRLFHPDAVDVSSGVEADTPEFTGKEKEKIDAFVRSVRDGGKDE